MLMTQEYLKSILRYCPETGMFSWLKTGKGIRQGRPVGTPDKDGYLSVRHKGKLHRMHRLAWLYMTGEWPEGQIDHVNRDVQDNRFANLRPCTNAENLRNREFAEREIPRGVHRSGKKFRVRVSVQGKNMDFGTYHDIELAELVAQEARRTHYGEFAS